MKEIEQIPHLHLADQPDLLPGGLVKAISNAACLDLHLGSEAAMAQAIRQVNDGEHFQLIAIAVYWHSWREDKPRLCNYHAKGALLAGALVFNPRGGSREVVLARINNAIAGWVSENRR